MLGIIGAMPEEVQEIIKYMNAKKTHKKSSFTYFEGKIDETKIIVSESGIGKVHMAACAQMMIDNWNPEIIINIGIAGALDTSLNIGDIVISDDAVYHDFDVTGLGYKIGELPDSDTSTFPADKDYLNRIRQILEKIVNTNDTKIIIGRVATGDQFISNKEIKQNIVKNVGGMCAEMEGAALAHVCYLNKVPFLIIRTISDKAEQSSVIDYPKFKEETCKIVSTLIVDLCKSIN